MAPVFRTDASHVVVAAVGVGGIFGVIVFGDDVVVFFALGQLELSFAVSHPDAELRTAERTEHHALVLRNLQRHETALKLVRVVVEHLYFS